MLTTINVKTLRRELGQIVERVAKGEGLMVLHRSRPAFRIVPIDGPVALDPVGRTRAQEGTDDRPALSAGRV